MSQAPLHPDDAEMNRTWELRTAIKRFACSSELRRLFDQTVKRTLGMDLASDQHEAEALRDWFTFEWSDENGVGVIDRFLESGAVFSEDDSQLLLGWSDSFSGIFEVKNAARSLISVQDLESGDVYEIIPDSGMDLALKRGQFVNARLLPLGDRFIFSYPPMLMPNRSAALEALQMNRIYNSLNSPEVQEEMLSAIRAVFVEYFESDEVSVTPDALSETVEGFLNYMFFVRVDPDTETTMADTFKQECNEDIWVPNLSELPSEFSKVSEVTILCDEFDGLLFLPEYSAFKRVFETADPDSSVPEWRELVSAYIHDPAIPTTPFEKVAEKHPKRLEKVMRELLKDESFSINQLYCALLHFKEPAEGFDNLKDDEKLWDLFDGQKKPSKAVKGAAAETRRKLTEVSSAKTANTRSKATASAAAGGTRKKIKTRS